MMNGYQRIVAALKGEWTDKRPIMLHNFMMAAREAGLSMKTFRENPQKAAKALINATEKYDIDGVLVDFDTATLASAVGVRVAYPEDEPALAIGPCLDTLEQVKDLAPVELSQNSRVQIWLETTRIVKEYFGSEKFIRGNCDQAPFSLASMMRSPANWMMDLLGESTDVFKLLDFCSDICIQFINLMAKAGADMISNGDSPAGPEMISPAMYKKFAFPYEKKLVEITHQLNLPYGLHICGDTGLILRDMLELGTDALELDYKTDIHLIYQLCGKKNTFFGNIDPSGIIRNGTPDQVEEKVVELLGIYKDSPGFVLNAGCAIPADAPSENIKRLITITRNWVISDNS